MRVLIQKKFHLPHEFIINRDLMAQLYPSFSKGLTPFFTINWKEYSDFITFKGGLNPVTGGLWLTDHCTSPFSYCCFIFGSWSSISY